MNQRALAVAIVIFVLIIGGMFGYAYMKKNKQAAEPMPEQPQEQEMEVTRVDAKHFFSDGTHTLAGEIMMPTPCDLLDANAVVRESSPEQVTLILDVINNSEEMCAQVMTAQRFKVSFVASEEAVIDATFRGEPVTLNLIEAGPNEDPDDFELFIKG